MAAQAVDLVAQGLLGDFKILRLPARPALPEIAAAPSGHDQNSLAVGEIEEFLGLEFAFETDGIQSHVADVAEFVVQALRVLAQHQVGGPAAAANQNVLAVDVKWRPPIELKSEVISRMPNSVCEWSLTAPLTSNSIASG